jgi:putative ABC transport system permease protein
VGYDVTMGSPVLKLAVRNLTRHRTRTAIALSAIAFGVVALLIAGGFIQWIFWAMREAAIQTGLGHVHITRPGFATGGLADPHRYLIPPDPAALAIVRAAPGVKDVDQRLVNTGLASNGDTSVAFSGEAVDPDADAQISKALPVQGQNLAAGDAHAVLLGTGIARALGVKRGDTVNFLVTLSTGGVNGAEARVAGTFSTGVKALDEMTVRMPLALGRQLLKVDGAHEWVVGLDDTGDTDRAMHYLSTHLAPERFAVASWLDLSDFYRKTVALLSRQIDVVALLIGLIIVLGISNTLTMNVLERTSEIGTMMALGNRRRDIGRLFATEALLLGVAAALIGLVVGVGLASALSAIGIPMPPPPGRDTGYSARIMLTPALVLGTFALAVVATTLAGLYPAVRASRTPIVDALRHNR